MSANDATDFALRLYGRVPANYRAYDDDQGQPLLALLRQVGAQAANLRADLDDLWDNFFIETCADWVVPYLGALVGANLLAQPIGQSNRLDVRNTIHWRRNKGTPAMLKALGAAISGWPTELAEFFRTIGWSQNMNHVRLDAPLTVDVRDPLRLSRLGHADDPWAHAADLRPSAPLDQPRLTQPPLGIGQAAWGTPGRHQIKNLGFFVNRLQTFRLRGTTAAAADPGKEIPEDPDFFTFDPLHRDAPLFEEATGSPITRAAFDAAPWRTFGKDIMVRKLGIPVATERAPQVIQSTSSRSFTFGDRPAGVLLHATDGLRLMNAQAFQVGNRPFIITASWGDKHSSTPLGLLNALPASRGSPEAYQPKETANRVGSLVITVDLHPAEVRFQGLLATSAAHFPGAVLAIRAATDGALHEADGRYIYLPAGAVTSGAPLEFFIADDGGSYLDELLTAGSLARASEGQVYPPRMLTNSIRTPAGFGALKPTELEPVDDSRGYDPSIKFRAEVIKAGTPFLAIRITANAGTFVPLAEVVVTNDRQQSLLAYLPEIKSAAAEGNVYLVADDGSTYAAPNTNNLTDLALATLPLARASAGQVLPLPGVWPLQQRRPVALNLDCDGKRRKRLQKDEIGIDPELGRFALPVGDSSLAAELSVDYLEGFSDAIGARTFDRALVQPIKEAKRIYVSVSGGGNDVYTTMTEAFDAATGAEVVIEITDSATYAVSDGIIFNQPTVKKLTIRAAKDQRPCLTFYQGGGISTPYSFRFDSHLEYLELNGLLISGGPMKFQNRVDPLQIGDVATSNANEGQPVKIQNGVDALHIVACTLDPISAAHGAEHASLIAYDSDYLHDAHYCICRSITGGLHIGKGISSLIVADSIVDQHDDAAIKSPDASSVQLERVTVLGRITCGVLTASECILDEIVEVNDQQAGCIRFSRFEFEKDLRLPRRYQCIPTEEQMRAKKPTLRLLAPMFNSRRFGRPDYLQLATGCPPQILAASENHGEIGAFAHAQNVQRLANLKTKLQEFMPVGLSALILSET
ncbi:MAG TPA: hypothetical protein VHR66_24760 [Gemmataceae bacterium]|jgi:hypothetical protein|nr:hypothetical protein [Gemmataceae bacterium]